MSDDPRRSSLFLPRRSLQVRTSKFGFFALAALYASMSDGVKARHGGPNRGTRGSARVSRRSERARGSSRRVNRRTCSCQPRPTRHTGVQCLCPCPMRVSVCVCLTPVRREVEGDDLAGEIRDRKLSILRDERVAQQLGQVDGGGGHGDKCTSVCVVFVSFWLSCVAGCWLRRSARAAAAASGEQKQLATNRQRRATAEDTAGHRRAPPPA